MCRAVQEGMKRIASTRSLLLAASMTVAGAATLLAGEATAEACSAPCMSMKPVFADRFLPTGIRGLLMPQNYSATPDLTLNGVPVPATIETVDGTRVLVPASPLTDGAYAISYTDQCGGSGSPTKADFVVGAAVPDPEKTGTISVTTRFVAGDKNPLENNDAVYRGGCGVGGGGLTYDHVVAYITFAPAKELKAYLPAMRFTNELTGPGNVGKSAFTVHPDTKEGLQIATVTVACNANAAPGANRQGVYTMSVAGELLGSKQVLPASVTSAEITCPPGAGADDGGGPFSDDGMIAPGGSQGASGCSVGASGATTPGTFGAIGVGILGLALGARRRRARG